jgi:hypothetical protein
MAIMSTHPVRADCYIPTISYHKETLSASSFLPSDVLSFVSVAGTEFDSARSNTVHDLGNLNEFPIEQFVQQRI